MNLKWILMVGQLLEIGIFFQQFKMLITFEENFSTYTLIIEINLIWSVLKPRNVRFSFTNFDQWNVCV